MLTARAAGRLSLPLTQHGYLYAVLAGLADKQEASAEALRESERRSGAQTPRGTVTVQGQAMDIGDALHKVYGPSNTAMPQAAKKTSPPSEEMRAKIAAMLGKTATPATPAPKDAAA
jgi:hypothetical protein